MAINSEFQVLFPCTDRTWEERTKKAAELDAKWRELGRGGDGDANLVAEQVRQAGEGYVLAIIDRNKYGFHVRDTHLDGGGRLSAHFDTYEDAVQYARAWHGEAPHMREVLDFYWRGKRIIIRQWSQTLGRWDTEAHAGASLATADILLRKWTRNGRWTQAVDDVTGEVLLDSINDSVQYTAQYHAVSLRLGQ